MCLSPAVSPLHSCSFKPRCNSSGCELQGASQCLCSPILPPFHLFTFWWHWGLNLGLAGAHVPSPFFL
jgi:hypothetical protein